MLLTNHGAELHRRCHVDDIEIETARGSNRASPTINGVAGV